MQGLAAIGATAAYLHAEPRLFDIRAGLTSRPAAAIGKPRAVETAIVHLGNSSIRFLHRMIDPTEGSELALLSQFGGQLDLDTQRPAPLPQPIRTAAAQLVIPVG